MNSIVYDLENGFYDLEVKTGPECKVNKKTMKLSFEAKRWVAGLPTISVLPTFFI